MKREAALLTKKPPLIRRMFSSVARSYDRLNHLLSFSLDRGWRRAAVRLSGAKPRHRILDACCGTGDLSLAFARRAAGAEIIAVDFSRDMLALASRKAAAVPSIRLKLVEADALRLPFREGSFDVAAVAFGLRNLQDASRGLSEMARVVKRGGKVIVLEFSCPSNPLLRAVYHFYIRFLLPEIARAIGRVGRESRHAYEYLPLSIIGFSDEVDLPHAMRQCGLAHIAAHPLAFGAVRIYIGGKANDSENSGDTILNCR